MPGIDTQRLVGVRWRGARAEITLAAPNGRGEQQLVLRRGRIDEAAVGFFAFRYCHWLAGEISSRCGWPLVLVERRGDWGGQVWVPIHTAVHTPQARLLDVRGEHTPAELIGHYRRPTGRDVRLRLVTAVQLGDRLAAASIMPAADHGPGWWRREAPDRPHRLVRHFAAVLLHHHGHTLHPPQGWGP